MSKNTLHMSHAQTASLNVNADKKPVQSAKKDRLAKALRENLLRRKAASAEPQD